MELDLSDALVSVEVFDAEQYTAGQVDQAIRSSVERCVKAVLNLKLEWAELAPWIERMYSTRGWVELGFASWKAYCADINLSTSWSYELIKRVQALRSSGLPALTVAVSTPDTSSTEGEISTEPLTNAVHSECGELASVSAVTPVDSRDGQVAEALDAMLRLFPIGSDPRAKSMRQQFFRCLDEKDVLAVYDLSRYLYAGCEWWNREVGSS